MDVGHPPMHNIGHSPYGFPPRSDSFKLFYFPLRNLEAPFNPLDGVFITLPTKIYAGIYLATVSALYLLLYLRHPSSRHKQIIALPIILCLLATPVFFTAANHLVHLVCALTSCCFAMRFIDHYYLKPLTGMLSHYNGQYSSYHAKRRHSNGGESKEEDDSHEAAGDAQHSQLSTQGRDDCSCAPSSREEVTLDAWLMWDKERIRTELWAPVRKLPNVGRGSTQDSGVPLTAILPSALTYLLIGDVIFLNLAETRYTDIAQLDPTTKRILFAAIGGPAIAVMMLYFFYLILVTWAILTRQRTLHRSEWVMTTHRFPLFTTDPADFWSQWHTMFKYIWADFAYFPLRRFAQLYLGPSRTGSKSLSKALELSLPVFGVFFLSGVSHAFAVWAAWRASPWSQINYFMVQALAVVATKAFQQTSPGRHWYRYYHTRSDRHRKWIDRVGMAAMVVFHIMTSPSFIEPYVRNEVWLGHRDRSVIYNLFFNR